MFRRPTLYLTLLLAAALAACSSAPTGVTVVEIVGGDRALEPGDQTLLSAYVVASAGNATTVTWSSNDDSVATVSSDGTLVAMVVGTATVTATSVADTSKTDSITVTVATDPASPQTVPATYAAAEGTEPALALALYFETEVMVASPASFTEVMEGLYFGPVGSIGADGSVDLVMPSTEDVPAAIMLTAETFTSVIDALADCDLTASDPTVAVSRVEPSTPLGNPGVAAMSLSGARPTIVTDEPLDPDTFTELELMATGHPTWVYAEEAVSVEAAGLGCTSGSVDMVIDLDLAAGWNQVTWDFGLDGATVNSVTLRNSDGEPVYITDVEVIL